jgi:hypothetical protein
MEQHTHQPSEEESAILTVAGGVQLPETKIED